MKPLKEDPPLPPIPLYLRREALRQDVEHLPPQVEDHERHGHQGRHPAGRGGGSKAGFEAAAPRAGGGPGGEGVGCGGDGSSSQTSLRPKMFLSSGRPRENRTQPS